MTALVAAVIVLVQVAAFSPNAEAASAVSKINSCDKAISTMNSTLVTIAKKRIAVRTAKKGGAKKVKKAKKSLKAAQKTGTQVRAKIKTYCGNGSGVSAQDAACSLSINSLSSSIQLAYTRKLAYKKIKGKSKAAKKRKRTMKTKLKKLNAKVAADTANFQKSCGNNSTGNGGGNSGDNNGGGNNTPADTTAPGAVTIVGPGSPNNDNTPTFTITPPSGETGGHIECKIDDGAYVTVTSPYTTVELTDGTHTITCRYVDAAGNAGPGTSTVITIDTTKPGTVTIDGPSGSTNDTTPTSPSQVPARVRPTSARSTTASSQPSPRLTPLTRWPRDRTRSPATSSTKPATSVTTLPRRSSWTRRTTMASRSPARPTPTTRPRPSRSRLLKDRVTSSASFDDGSSA